MQENKEIPVSETTLKLDIIESYYIQSKFKFHIIAPAIVDENDYYDDMDPSEMDSKKKKELEKKKKENKDKESNTILLVAIKNGSVYSYVRENKLGKVLGLSSKYAPKGISKHGLFVLAMHKKKNTWAVFEMTSGTLTQLESKLNFVTSYSHLVPYVSEDGNFIILFDKGTLKFHIIDNAQDDKNPDHLTEVMIQSSKTLKLIEYPDAYKEQFNDLNFYPNKWRCMDIALGIRGEDSRIFTIAMLLFSPKDNEALIFIGRIYTSDKIYLNHITRIYKFDPFLSAVMGLYTIKLEDKDGDYLAIHCSEYNRPASRFYIVETGRVEDPTQDIVSVIFNKKIVIEYQWIALKEKYLVCITRDLELMLLNTRGQQMMMFFNKNQGKIEVPLPYYLTKRVTDISTIQFFNVNTEGHLVLFIDKNVLSLDFNHCQDIKVEESNRLNQEHTLVKTRLIIFEQGQLNQNAASFEKIKKISSSNLKNPIENPSQILNQSNNSRDASPQQQIPNNNLQQPLQQFQQMQQLQPGQQMQQNLQVNSQNQSLNQSQQSSNKTTPRKEEEKKGFNWFGSKKHSSNAIASGTVDANNSGNITVDRTIPTSQSNIPVPNNKVSNAHSNLQYSHASTHVTNQSHNSFQSQQQQPIQSMTQINQQANYALLQQPSANGLPKTLNSQTQLQTESGYLMTQQTNQIDNSQSQIPIPTQTNLSIESDRNTGIKKGNFFQAGDIIEPDMSSFKPVILPKTLQNSLNNQNSSTLNNISTVTNPSMTNSVIPNNSSISASKSSSSIYQPKPTKPMHTVDPDVQKRKREQEIEEEKQREAEARKKKELEEQQKQKNRSNKPGNSVDKEKVKSIWDDLISDKASESGPLETRGDEVLEENLDGEPIRKVVHGFNNSNMQTIPPPSLQTNYNKSNHLQPYPQNSIAYSNQQKLSHQGSNQSEDLNLKLTNSPESKIGSPGKPRPRKSALDGLDADSDDERQMIVNKAKSNNSSEYKVNVNQPNLKSQSGINPYDPPQAQQNNKLKKILNAESEETPPASTDRNQQITNTLHVPTLNINFNDNKKSSGQHSPINSFDVSSERDRKFSQNSQQEDPRLIEQRQLEREQKEKEQLEQEMARRAQYEREYRERERIEQEERENRERERKEREQREREQRDKELREQKEKEERERIQREQWEQEQKRIRELKELREREERELRELREARERELQELREAREREIAEREKRDREQREREQREREQREKEQREWEEREREARIKREREYQEQLEREREQREREREQREREYREKEEREYQLRIQRERELREQELRERERKEREQIEQIQREKEKIEREMRDQEAREREQYDRDKREREQREREREQREREQYEREKRDREERAREQREREEREREQRDREYRSKELRDREDYEKEKKEREAQRDRERREREQQDYDKQAKGNSNQSLEAKQPANDFKSSRDNLFAQIDMTSSQTHQPQPRDSKEGHFSRRHHLGQSGELRKSKELSHAPVIITNEHVAQPPDSFRNQLDSAQVELRRSVERPTTPSEFNLDAKVVSSSNQSIKESLSTGTKNQERQSRPQDTRALSQEENKSENNSPSFNWREAVPLTLTTSQIENSSPMTIAEKIGLSNKKTITEDSKVFTQQSPLEMTMTHSDIVLKDTPSFIKDETLEYSQTQANMTALTVSAFNKDQSSIINPSTLKNQSEYVDITKNILEASILKKSLQELPPSEENIQTATKNLNTIFENIEIPSKTASTQQVNIAKDSIANLKAEEPAQVRDRNFSFGTKPEIPVQKTLPSQLVSNNPEPKLSILTGDTSPQAIEKSKPASIKSIGDNVKQESAPSSTRSGNPGIQLPSERKNSTYDIKTSSNSISNKPGTKTLEQSNPKPSTKENKLVPVQEQRLDLKLSGQEEVQPQQPKKVVETKVLTNIGDRLGTFMNKILQAPKLKEEDPKELEGSDLMGKSSSLLKPPRHEVVKSKIPERPINISKIEKVAFEVLPSPQITVIKQKGPAKDSKAVKKLLPDPKPPMIPSKVEDFTGLLCCQDALSVVSKVPMLLSNNENSDMTFLREMLLVELQFIEKWKISKQVFKKLWLLLIHKIINNFLLAKKQAQKSAAQITKLAASYYISKECLRACIVPKPKKIQDQILKVVKKAKPDIDNEKVFKKFTYKFNEDDFDVFKIIKYCRIILDDKNYSTQIVATCIFTFLHLLKDMATNVWNGKKYFRSIPLMMHRDIIGSLSKIRKIEELDQYIVDKAKKYSLLNPSKVKTSGKIVVHYKDVNIVNLLLYIINFTNHITMFSPLAETFAGFVEEDPHIRNNYLMLIILLLRDKIDLFESKCEVIKAVRDRRLPDQVEKIETKLYSLQVKKIHEISIHIIELMNSIEYPTENKYQVIPKDMISPIIILSESGLLNQKKAYLDKILLLKLGQIKKIAQDASKLDTQGQSEFYTQLGSCLMEQFGDTNGKWFFIYNLNKIKKIEIPSKKLTNDIALVIKAYYELSYLINREEFYRNQEDSGTERLSGDNLYYLSKYLMWIFIKSQLALLHSLDMNEDPRVELLNLYYFYSLPSITEFSNPFKIEELGEYLGLINNSLDNNKIEDPELKEILENLLNGSEEVSINHPSKTSLQSAIQSLAKHVDGYDPSKSMKLKYQLLNNLFPERLAEPSMKIGKFLYNNFLEKMVNVQTSENKKINGYQDFYAMQKRDQEETLSLYSKLEKKYASVFTLDKKNNKNLLFVKGQWYYLFFPMERKLQPASH